MTKQYGIVIDLRRCFGCETCTLACRMENNTPIGIKFNEVFSVGNVGNGGWRSVSEGVPDGKFPNLKMYYLPVLCNHCGKPACKENLKELITKRNDGIVFLEEEKEKSHKKDQTAACPYGRIFWNEKDKKLVKCDFCMSRIDEDKKPLCVESCPAKARHFGNLNDPNSDVSKFAKLHKAKPLFPDLKTNPSVLYIMPRGEDIKAVGEI